MCCCRWRGAQSCAPVCWWQVLKAALTGQPAVFCGGKAKCSCTQRLLACACLLPTPLLCLCVVCPAQMDQFFFMADRHDPSFCCVRYMTDVRLREWKVYLQPVAKRECSPRLCC